MQSRCSAVTATDDPAILPYTITSPGRFAARHAFVQLDRIQMQYGEENFPRIWEGSISPERCGISLLIQPGPPVFSSGTEIGFDEIAIHNPGGPSLCHRLSGPARWAALSLPLEDWARMGATILDRDMTPPAHPPRAAVSETGLSMLRRLHAATIRLAEQAPDIVADPDAARGLEAELMVGLAETLRALVGQAMTAASHNHARIMRRFRQYLDENPGKPIYLPELCSAIGTSDRTLRLCCHENFGMGPKRYLYLRRLHLARSELLQPNSVTLDVTGVATQFGFWELGRFAVHYRRLFGEPPSATLHRARAS